MLNTNPSRSFQSAKSVSLFNSFRKKLFFPKNSFLEIDLNVCEEFLQKEETPKSDSNFFLRHLESGTEEVPTLCFYGPSRRFKN
ncbi:hypothetical protein LEP1GSC188_0400 [Leptospira weilii serovar Topaz str. LT2116]|uniref:Uncharacterized protein n=1 Tax=Leptospira weilii serovar Topaz str. LT2116 TaxID=1088540 RepID=M3EG13_9LEPT|nr:hypothetical protein LEP1GSC188_0400 [Leptospira weilii serovar Topaz str. LT2116]